MKNSIRVKITGIFTVFSLLLIGCSGETVDDYLNFRNISQDSVDPSIVSVTSAASDGFYKAADQINITVTFSEPVILSGAMSAGLNTGNNTSLIPDGGNISDIYTGTYIVADGDNTDDLDVLEVTLDSGTLTDEAGNGAVLTLPETGLADARSISIDTAAPEATVSSLITSPTNAIFNITITFSEDVSDFAVEDISVTNGTAGSFSGSGAVYTATITPGSEGVVEVSVAAGVALDEAANPNINSNTLNMTYDSVLPTVSVSTLATSPTNSPFDITITFSEDMTDFTVGDISVINGTAGSFSGSGAVYTATITPDSESVVEVSIAPLVAFDEAANPNINSNTLNMTYDISHPIITMTPSANPVNGQFTVTIKFNEHVTGFTSGDITLTNATLADFTTDTDGIEYTALIDPVNSPVLIEINNNIADDDAGNGNNSAIISVTFIPDGPTVNITSLETNPTNNNSVLLTMTFSHSIDALEFSDTDIIVTNGTVEALSLTEISIDQTIYTFNISLITDGPVTVRLPADSVYDLASNGNTASNIYSFTYDSTDPDCAQITTTAADPTNSNTLNATVTFSEEVSAEQLTAGDFALTNCAINSINPQTGYASSFTVNLTAVSEGVFTIQLNPGTTVDRAANPNTVSATALSRTYDATLPTATVSTLAADPVNAAFEVAITFSESVSNFVAGDITVTNGTAGTFSGTGASYSAIITPSAQGAVTVNVGAGVAQDAATNLNTASNTLTMTYDSLSPTVSVSTLESNPTNSPFDVTITFSESVSDFVAGDITVTNGTAGSFGGSGTTYTATITPSAQGAVTASVAADAAHDSAANGNTVSNTLSMTYDSVSPAVTLSTSAPDPVNAAFDVTITFSENVTGFDISDISVTNGNRSSFSGAGASYSVTITPSAQGTVTVDVGAGAAQDTAANPNTASNTISLAYDSVVPTVIVSTLETSPTNSAFDVTVTFSESVSDFVVGDITVTNGTAGTFGGTGASYTATITPSGQGAVTVNVEAGVAQDDAANANTASNTLNMIYDSLSPSVTVSTSEPSPTNSAFDVAITFSESVSGFAVGDITVTNGTAGTFSGTGASYTATITPSAQGAVTVNVGAGVAQDNATNANTASNTLNMTYDSAQPTVTVSTSAADPTNAAFGVTITFSESVTGFVLGDITVTNGTAGSFGGSGTTYTATITPSAQGAVTVRAPAGVASDSAGNMNLASNTLNMTYDSVQPAVTVSTAAANPINAAFDVAITFSESVTGFVLGDITVTNGSAGSFSGSGDTYTATITPAAQGAVTVSVGAGAAQDAATNQNTVSNTLNMTYDSASPTVTVSTAAANPTNAAFGVTITFSESVTGFVLGDITVTNGTAGTFSGSGAVYTSTITPSGQGAVTVRVLAGVASDSATNLNTVSNTLNITYDSVQPTVTVSTAASSPVNAAFGVTITFSESVTGFVAGDITVTNGTAGTFSGTGTTYTATITPTAQGAVTVSVGAGVVQDSATNTNTVSNTLNMTYDSVQPTVTVSTAAANPTNAAFGVTITFSESVTGFVLGDITVSNGTAGTFGGSGTTYTATITPTAQGAVTVRALAGVAADSAGNTNTVSNTLNMTYDSVQPTVTVSTAAANPVNAAFGVTITFSESVSDFVLGDITVTNGNAGSFGGSGTAYTATITPAAQGAVTVSVAAGVAQDSATNTNTASNTLNMTYDSVSPTVTLSTLETSPANSPYDVTITFSESVSDFAFTDISVTNCTVTDFSGSGTTYTATVARLSEGASSVSVAAGVAHDSATNPNTVSNTINMTFDTVSPTVTVSTSAADPTNAAFSVTITFSESVTGFVVGDITVTNGSAGSFGGSGTTYTATITPTAQGAVTVSVGAGAAQDDATNANTASNTLSRTYDSVQPTVTVSTSESSPTNSPFDVTITFSESVTGFVIGDITVTNGSAGSFSGSGDTYTATITPAAQGAVTVSVSAGVAQDAATNLNTVSNTLNMTYDSSVPTVTVSTAAANPTNAAFGVTITFSESVTGFVVGDITVTNGSAGAFGGTGASYTATITPSGQGAVTVNVGAGVAQDAAANANSASNTLNITYDSVQPTVTVSTAASNPVNAAFGVTITFSESVTGFVVGDITVTNGTAGTFSGTGASYTATITPSAQGAVTVSVGAGVAQDSATNTNTVSNTLNMTYDSVQPTVTVSTSATSPTNAAFGVTITFSESVTGFVVGDITVSNGTAGTFSGTGASYTATITPSGQGAVTVRALAGVAADSAGNTNTVSNTLNMTYDSVQPTVTVSTSATSPVNAAFGVTITFSESVTGFVVGDITVTNGTAGTFSGTGASYTATITPSAQGAVTVSVGAGVAQDSATNTNTVSNTLNMTYDSVQPTVTVSTSATSPVNAAFSVTITFSESVTGFVVGDITVTNATAGTFSGTGASYTATITPSAQGAVTVSVGAGVAQDSATNTNTVSNTLNMTYDSVRPTVTVSTAASNPTNAAFGVTMTFSESVTGFVVGDITVTNGSAGSFGGSGTTYTATITPTAQGAVTVQVAAGVAQDSATNTNTVSNTLNMTYDTVQPTVSVTAGTSPTNSNPVFTILFSESVTGFVSGDLAGTVTNGTVSGLSGTGASYTATITPSSSVCTVTLSVAAGVANDAAGNSNTASPSSASVNYDGALPTITEALTLDIDNNGKIDCYRITFSESVNDSTFPGYVANGTGSVTTEWNFGGTTYVNERLVHGTAVTYATDTPNDNRIYVEFDEVTSGYDTGVKPDITVTNGGLTDSVGNVIANVSGTDITETDGAKPIIIYASGITGTIGLSIVFSEAVSSSIASAYFTYNDASAGGAGSLSSMSEADGSDSGVTAVLNVNLTSGDLAVDTLYPSASGLANIADAAGNYINTNSVFITGAVAPYVLSGFSTSSTTCRLYFSEPVVASEATTEGNYTLTYSSGSITINDITQGDGAGAIYNFTVASPLSASTTYTLTVTGTIHDQNEGVALVDPMFASFLGDEQLTIGAATCLTTTSVLVVFNKPLLAGTGAYGSERAGNYKFTGPNDIGDVNGAPVTATRGSTALGTDNEVTLTHTYEQKGVGYMIIGANNTNGDGFDDTGYVIRNDTQTENLQTAPGDRLSWNGCGAEVTTIDDGPIALDPFGDTSDFGYLVSYNGMVYIGPNVDGNSATRMEPTGKNPLNVDFTFSEDSNSSVGVTSDNTASSIVSIGHTGCTDNSNSAADGCGPDNENGRGIFVAGTVDSTEQLFITGSKSTGNNDYIYWTPDTDSTLDFKYIDGSEPLDAENVGGNRNTESIVISGGNVYWMQPGNLSYRPYFTKLSLTGNSGNDVDITSTTGFLHMRNVPGMGADYTAKANTADIIGGTVYSFNDYLYVGNNGSVAYYYSTYACYAYFRYRTGGGGGARCDGTSGTYLTSGGQPPTTGSGYVNTGGIVRSTSNDPTGSASWTDITPGLTDGTPGTNTSYRNYYSIILGALGDVIPSQRPIPAFATFNGNLYMIRNACTRTMVNTSQTTCNNYSTCQTGVSSDDILTCSGAGGTPVLQLWKCVPGANSQCDASEWSLVFTNTTENAITMLVANGSYLYVGFDNSTVGIKIYRTADTSPASWSNFSQVSTNGLGRSDMRQIFSAISIQQGADYYIYVSAGMGSEPVAVYREVNN